jgi:hypothetical protein
MPTVPLFSAMVNAARNARFGTNLSTVIMPAQTE